MRKEPFCLLAKRFVFLLLVIIVFAFINVIVHILLKGWGIHYPFFKTLYNVFDSTVYAADKLLFKTGYKLNSHTGVPTDSLFSVIFLTLNMLMILLVAMVWTIVDRNKSNASLRMDNYYIRIREVVRIVLAIVMFHYGIIKLFLLQMPANSIDQLLTPLGFFNRQELMWAFIGTSKGFQFFLGLSECIAGVLLLFRKTSLLGILCSFTITINVCIMNFSYDVPARMLACLLMTMIVFLVTPYIKILYAFFIQGRTAQVISPAVALKEAGYQKFQRLIVVSVFFIFGMDTFFSISKLHPTPDYASCSIYQAQTFINGKDGLHESGIENDPWNLLIFKPNKMVSVIRAKGDRSDFKYEVDSVTNKLSLFRHAYYNDSIPLHVYSINMLAGKEVILNAANDSVSIRLKFIPSSVFDFEINSKKKWTDKLPVYSVK